VNEFSEAPPELPRADPIAGELVTETFDYDGGRQVTVYVPPDPPEAIVFAGDGQMISQWGGVFEKRRRAIDHDRRRARQCSAYRRVGTSRSPSDFDTRISMARSSLPRLARVIDRLTCCHLRCRARTSWPDSAHLAHW